MHAVHICCTCRLQTVCVNRPTQNQSLLLENKWEFFFNGIHMFKPYQSLSERLRNNFYLFAFLRPSLVSASSASSPQTVQMWTSCCPLIPSLWKWSIRRRFLWIVLRWTCGSHQSWRMMAADTYISLPTHSKWAINREVNRPLAQARSSRYTHVCVPARPHTCRASFC